jgi:hypothetical protein
LFSLPPFSCHKGFFFLLLPFLLYFFSSFPHVVKGLLLCVFRHFNLLLLALSLSLHLATARSVPFVLAYYYLFPPLCFTLLLFVTSFMIGPIYCCLLLACYLLRVWPYCYLFVPSCLVLLLPKTFY